MPPLLPTPMLVAAGVVAFTLAPPSRGAPDEQPPARRRSVRHRRPDVLRICRGVGAVLVDRTAVVTDADEAAACWVCGRELADDEPCRLVHSSQAVEVVAVHGGSSRDGIAATVRNSPRFAIRLTSRILAPRRGAAAGVSACCNSCPCPPCSPDPARGRPFGRRGPPTVSSRARSVTTPASESGKCCARFRTRP
jgi:hypothetical protein